MAAILNPFLAYFGIVDPMGTSLIFNALTKGRTDAYYRKMAIRSVCLSTVLVLCFGLWGIDLLRVLGIQMEYFGIAGCLLLFYVAFGMTSKPDTRDDNQPVNEQDDISVFPLSIPLIAGPGCLTLTVLLFSKASEHKESFIPLMIALLIIYLFTLICFLFSNKLAKFVGQTINNIVKRLLGVLLASLALQFVADGVKGLVS